MVSEQGRWGKKFLIIFIFENLEKQVRRISNPRNEMIVALKSKEGRRKIALECLA